MMTTTKAHRPLPAWLLCALTSRQLEQASVSESNGTQHCSIDRLIAVHLLQIVLVLCIERKKCMSRLSEERGRVSEACSCSILS